MPLEIHSSLLSFSEGARSSIDDFTRHLNLLPNNFKECLIHIKPKFILVDKSDTPVLEISDDDSDTTDTNVVTPSKRRMAPPQTPAKRQRGMTPAASNAGGSFVKPEDSDGGSVASPGLRPPPPSETLAPPFEAFSKINRSFRTLAQVREEIQKKTKAGMPQRNPDEVYEDLVIEAIKPWTGPMEVFLGETMKSLNKVLLDALRKSFESLKKRVVFKEACGHLAAFLKAHHKQTRESLMLLYKMETHRLLTFNNDAFDSYKADELQLLTRFRHKMRMEKKGLQAPKALEDWTAMTQAKRDVDNHKRASDLQKIGRDQFEREVDVIAYIRGYYKLAALRFTDAVAQLVLCRMIPDIKEKISFHLHEELGVFRGADNSVYARLMEEDPHVAQKREVLKREKDKFVKALESIDALNMRAGVGADVASVYTADEHHDDASAI